MVIPIILQVVLIALFFCGCIIFNSRLDYLDEQDFKRQQFEHKIVSKIEADNFTSEYPEGLIEVERKTNTEWYLNYKYVYDNKVKKVKINVSKYKDLRGWDNATIRNEFGTITIINHRDKTKRFIVDKETGFCTEYRTNEY